MKLSRSSLSTLFSSVTGAIILAAGSAAHGAVTKAAWGSTADGKPVEIYTLASKDLTVKVATYGARIVSIEAPDKNGKKADVALGYSSVAGYEADKNTYVGSIVGRYGNRIAKGTFSIAGHEYHVPLNNNGNALHGGTTGFDRKVWTAREIADGVEMTLVSPDGDMGFPGELTAHVRYTLEGDALTINYSANTTKPTEVNLTNHAYFNLAGEGNGTILNQEIMIAASHYTPVDAGLIPLGTIPTVVGTPLDFLHSTAIGKRIGDSNEQLKLAGGYDHNWVLDAKGPGLHLAAKVVDPSSGRTLTVTTTQPGVQFYSGNFLEGAYTGVSGKKYEKHFGFCLETQHFPDSPNHANFPSTLLKPGETMHSETVFTFGVQK
jgi:aldose 1-epimerase